MMPRIRFIGAHPLAKDEQGRLKSRIGTVFPSDRTVITEPPMAHMSQREAYLDLLAAERQQRGQPPFTDKERIAVWEKAVDLIMEEGGVIKQGDCEIKEEDRILIRPDPDNMPLAAAADELLRELVPTRQVRWLNVYIRKVRDWLKRHGQYWRIAPLPTTHDEMEEMIAKARWALQGRVIYYHNNATGVRFLTCEGFAGLSGLEPEELRRHLLEIQEYSARINRMGNPEVDFFLAGGGFSKEDFAGRDFGSMDAEQLKAVHKTLAAKFHDQVPQDLRRDDPRDPAWRSRMYSALLPPREEVTSEEGTLGLSSEFFMQIEWLPGAELQEGELIVDPSFLEPAPAAEGQGHRGRWDEKSRGLLFNFIREYGDLEYVNIGRVAGSLSLTRESRGRREVYIVQLKPRDYPDEIVKILRKQKYDVDEHLDRGKPLLHAMREAEDYTDYVLDRRLGCRQLGMNLTPRITAHKIRETYQNRDHDYHGVTIWSTYFEREYVAGVATDKIARWRFEKDDYSVRFAALLGRAAAPNMIVGRCERDEKGVVKKIVFDDGDEVVQDDPSGLPERIVVVDQMGTFVDFKRPLMSFAKDYAEPVNRRLGLVRCPVEFANAYLDAFLERFTQIQQEYFRRKRAFDSLFRHQPWDPEGNFRYRWEMVLNRLQGTDAQSLTDAIRGHVELKV
jgi:hypothetical protein